MPARDIYHDAVKNAPVKDGWTITDDPHGASASGRTLYLAVPQDVVEAVFQ